jgi:nicotinate phosphoribosyltransferase
MALADLIALDGESIDESAPLEIFHPLYTYKRKILTNFSAHKLLRPVFKEGKFVGVRRTVSEIARFSKEQKSKFWLEHLRNVHPQSYKVDLSQKLWDIRKSLINECNLNLKEKYV